MTGGLNLALPPGEIEQAQGAAPRDRGGRSLMSYWLKEPYYMSKWTYFHRPSVWNAVGGQRGLTWHGLYGFKTVFAGAGGIGYRGGPRTVHPAMRWALRAGGRGFETAGRAFTRMGMVTGPVGRIIRPAARGISTRAFQFGRGFRAGGVAGGLRGVGTTRIGTVTEQIFGGAATRYGAFRLPFEQLMRPGLALPIEYMNLERTLGTGVARARGVMPLISHRARRRAAVGVIRGLTPEERVLFAATGKVGRTALTRGIMWRAGGRAMAAVTVGLNIALFGGLLANLAQGGTRMLGEAAWNARMNRRVPALEFGRGIDPFPQPGSLTERQRAVQAIQSSHLNARSFLGNEAALMHDRSQY